MDMEYLKDQSHLMEIEKHREDVCDAKTKNGFE